MDREEYVSSVSGPVPLMVVEERPLSAKECAIGEVVAGKYLVEGVIGRGSMGVVVRAKHLGFDELVALKFIRPEMRKVDGILSRFAREAKASVRIRNEHAVNVLDVGVADPIGPFFVMEYLEGINLEELVDSQGAFEPAIAVKYVLETCEALAAAHAQGIIHRDIKPQNIFLAWQGRLELIKVLDFGISKAALRGQMFGDDLSISEKDWVMGTPLYMSPEQLRHAPDVDERSDIWSLGAVLYELLCGQPLFSGDTQTEVCRQVMEVERRQIRVDVTGVSDELWHIIERCLSHDKDRRYSNVAELGEALLPFGPSGSCLHVERARALLGLRPIAFLGFDDDIEDIDAEPIEENDAADAVVPLARPLRPPRHAYWVELALPVLACAVVWIGLRQWQLSQASVSRSDDALETVAFALTQRPDCPVPAPAAAPPAETSTPETSTPSTNPASALDEPQGLTNLPSTAPAAPAASTLPLTPAPPTPPAAPVASARRVAPRPLAPSPRVLGARHDPVAPAALSPAEEASPVRRAQKPKVEPKLQFRLIGEQPSRGFGLVPSADAESATLPSATSPSASSP